ncbi:MAG TPA: circadian clock KaiB family protein, partial [Burkholderiaceae bacterium]|nr:circadian clock KaiB family protein [Burkholderiaceae bacterium]
GRYELDVIDIYRHPELAVQEQIVAVPTLVRQLPEPLRRSAEAVQRRASSGRRGKP